MSYIGKKLIKCPNSIKIVNLDNHLNISGPLGKMSIILPPEIGVVYSDNQIEVKYLIPSQNNRFFKKKKALWGTYRSLINNMIIGVSRGFTVKLELVGVGYRASKNNNNLVLKLGYSHDVIYEVPEYVTVECIKPTLISVNGIDKQQVNQIASNIRSFRKPDAYKGKGIRYYGEVIKLKEGKKK